MRNQYPVSMLLAVVLLATACGGSVAPTEPMIDPPSVDSERAGAVVPGELAGLVRAIETPGISEAAVIQMLAFRERVYLPFRYRQGLAIDGRGILAGRDLDPIRDGFEQLGADGGAILQRCVREAATERVGSVHLVGDDAALLGRACLEMLARAYGDGALPFLVAFAREVPQTPTATLLQRATLELLPSLAPDAVLPARATSGDWRMALSIWSAWLRTATVPTWSRRRRLENAQRAVRRSSFGPGSRGASEHLVAAGVEAPEPRYVTTLRAFVAARAERWVPLLSEASKDALSRRDTISALETALLVDLWASVSSEQYPTYFRRIVLPTLVYSIRASDAGQPYSRPRSHSEYVIEALHAATGVRYRSPACGTVPSASSTRRCLFEQARSWRGYLLAGSWSI